MNNEELFEWFRTIAVGNSFDIALVLRDKQNIKKYKTSDFYKKTHYSFRKAYTIYNSNSVKALTDFANSKLIKELAQGHYSYLLVLLEDLINEMDFTAFDDLLNYISDRLLSIDTDKLQAQLQQTIKEYSDIIKRAK